MTRPGSMSPLASMAMTRPGSMTRPGPMTRPGSGSGPALVISSSGAPPPRDSHPATNGRRCSAAFSTAGSTEA